MPNYLKMAHFKSKTMNFQQFENKKTKKHVEALKNFFTYFFRL